MAALGTGKQRGAGQGLRPELRDNSLYIYKGWVPEVIMFVDSSTRLILVCFPFLPTFFTSVLNFTYVVFVLRSHLLGKVGVYCEAPPIWDCVRIPSASPFSLEEISAKLSFTTLQTLLCFVLKL